MFEFKFPDVGEGIVEGEVRRWLVKEGDRVKADQPLVEVETDKALVELPAPRAGTVLKICAREGETIKVGQVVVVIGEPGELSEPAPESQHESVTVVGALDANPVEFQSPPPVAIVHPPRVRAIPSVRKLARELGVNLARIKGTGIDGRIRREDVLKAAEERKARQPAPAPVVAAKIEEKVEAKAEEAVERVSMSRLRRTIAATMVQSAFTAPHVTSHDEVEVTRLLEIVRRERPAAEARGVHLTLLPFVVKAVVAGLKAEPYLNAELRLEAGEILLKKRYHIGIATDTAEGLIVPVVKDADRKPVLELAREIAALTEKAKSRTAALSEVTGSTFTITNYGAFGGTFGTPIINPPEVAILGLGRAQEKPVARDGQVVIRPMLPLSLSFDHRLIDGAMAQRFLNVAMARLEDPDLLLLEL
jgi:pyruvate dehydrogenase E2 component (dihydrolipoamide acetyltransferase)